MSSEKVAVLVSMETAKLALDKSKEHKERKRRALYRRGLAEQEDPTASTIRGGLKGGLRGGIAGTLLGVASGKPGRGAAIGAIGGGALGATLGNRMAKATREVREGMPERDKGFMHHQADGRDMVYEAWGGAVADELKRRKKLLQSQKD